MLIVLKIVLLAGLLALVYQDFKERKVYLSLLLIPLFLLGFLNYKNSLASQFLINTTLNFALVIIILGFLFFYSKYKLKESLQNTFGLGDALFFLVIAVGFPTFTFIVLFSFSLIFSLVLFLIIKKNFKQQTVPLAGLQALFLSLLLSLNWIFNFVDLYLI